MSSFDNVTFFCPYCNEKIIIQSKSGLCELKNYHQESVPASIAENLKDGSVVCKKCHSHFLITGTIPRVSLFLIDSKLENGYD